MKDNFEKLGCLIDELDNLAHALDFPLEDKTHVERLRKLLPEKVIKFKKVYEDITGENPWD